MKFFTLCALVGLTKAVSMRSKLAAYESGDELSPSDMVALISTLQAQVVELDTNAQRLTAEFEAQVAQKEEVERQCRERVDELNDQIDLENTHQQDLVDAHSKRKSDYIADHNQRMETLIGQQDAEISRLQGLIDHENSEQTRLRNEAADLNGQAGNREGETATLADTNAGLEQDARDHWAGELADAEARRTDLTGQRDGLLSKTQGQASTIQGLREELGGLETDIPVLSSQKGDLQDALDHATTTNPQEVARVQAEYADLVDDNAVEKGDLEQQRQSWLDARADELRLAKLDINNGYDAELQAEVDEHVARSEDTVFEVCTRIDRDPEAAGHFRVETVTRGDPDDAALQLQAMVEAQNLQLTQERVI